MGEPNETNRRSVVNGSTIRKLKPIDTQIQTSGPRFHRNRAIALCYYLKTMRRPYAITALMYELSVTSHVALFTHKQSQLDRLSLQVS